MGTFVDLSHTLRDGMPAFRLKNEDGSYTEFTATIRPFITHEESKLKYNGKAAFETTELILQPTSVGTYLDSPYHRYRDMRDISDLTLDDVILDGIVMDSRGSHARNSIGLEALPELAQFDLTEKAVLFNFGWDKYWGTEEYHSYPFIGKDVINYLIQERVKLVGVDTINVDDSRDMTRPAHSNFLKTDILIVENLMNLHLLHGKIFRFFAVPTKCKGVAAIPIRAFAEIM